MGDFEGSYVDRIVEARGVLAGLPVAKDVLVARPDDVVRARGCHDSVIRTAVEEGIELYQNPSVREG